MSKIRQAPAISIHSLILLTLLAAMHGLVFAQSYSVELPENARAKSYGSGWERGRGFREDNGTCAAIGVPADAYPTNSRSGNGWKCDRGYRKVNEACPFIKVPPNAYLNTSGDRWRCNRGYRAVDETCVAIPVPANGYQYAMLQRQG
jgi:hypothetical protein